MSAKGILGGVIIVVTIICVIIIYYATHKSPPETTSNNNIVVEFPTSGTGCATSDKPAKAHLNPRKSVIQVTGAGHMKFMLASNPSIFWYCNDKKPKGSTAKTGLKSDWDCMPDGDYFVYPNGCDKVCVSWW
jgi:hypothetical protein